LISGFVALLPFLCLAACINSLLGDPLDANKPPTQIAPPLAPFTPTTTPVPSTMTVTVTPTPTFYPCGENMCFTGPQGPYSTPTPTTTTPSCAPEYQNTEYCQDGPWAICNRSRDAAPAWCYPTTTTQPMPAYPGPGPCTARPHEAPEGCVPATDIPNDPCNDISTPPTWCYGTPSTSTYVPPPTLPPAPPLTLLPQQTVPGVPMVPPPGQEGT
jgi:hypothetical protein